MSDIQPGRRITAFAVAGIPLVLFALMLMARMLWEETFLTRRFGPQMLGFSLAHGYGAILFLGPILLSLWLIVAFVGLIVYLIRHRPIASLTKAVAAAGVLILGMLSIPPEFWIWLLAGWFAGSPKVADIVTAAAYQNQVRTTIRLMNHGVSVNATDYQGDTPLHAAAAQGNVTLIEFLLARHAPVNQVNFYGDSPLQRAYENHHADAIRILESSGAQRVQGTEEQRNAGAQRIVDQQIKEEDQRR